MPARGPADSAGVPARRVREPPVSLSIQLKTAGTEQAQQAHNDQQDSETQATLVKNTANVDKTMELRLPTYQPDGSGNAS